MQAQSPEAKACSHWYNYSLSHLSYMTAATPLFFCNSMTSGVSFFFPHVNSTRFLSVTLETRSRFDSREAESKFIPWGEGERGREERGGRARGREGWMIVYVTVVGVCITTYQ